MGTEILEVCAGSKCVADQCFESGRSKEVNMGLKSIGTGILEVC